MKLKLDENLGVRGRKLLAAAGHDVCTVPEQDLCSATDEQVSVRCRSDERGIVTLALDFANPFRFPPSQHHGIAVLRAPARMSEEVLHRLIATLIGALKPNRSRVPSGLLKKALCVFSNLRFEAAYRRPRSSIPCRPSANCELN